MALTSPLARSAGIANEERSTAFYRDVLRFDVRKSAQGIFVSSGPAELHLNVTTRPEPEIFFFETSDVATVRAEIVERGGKASALARVNWIKMEMFEIRDPDEHTLWFGQSFDRPEAELPSPMLQKALPELPLDDLAAGVEYYRDVLGFHINYQQHDLAVVYRDQVTILLVARTEKQKGIGSAYIYIENADKLFAELHANRAIVMKEPVSQPWGLREFHVADLEANEIHFGQPFE